MYIYTYIQTVKAALKCGRHTGEVGVGPLLIFLGWCRRRYLLIVYKSVHAPLLNNGSQIFFYPRLNSCTVHSHFRIKSISVNKCRSFLCSTFYVKGVSLGCVGRIKIART